MLTDDVNRVEKIFTHLTAEWVAAAAVPLLFVIALVWIDWRLAVSLVVTLPLAVAALNAARRFFLARADRKQEQFLEVSGLLVEFVTGIRTLRLFNRAGGWWERLDRRFEAIRHSSMGVEAWAGGSVQLYRLCLELGLVALLLCGAWLAKAPRWRLARRSDCTIAYSTVQTRKMPVHEASAEGSQSTPRMLQ